MTDSLLQNEPDHWMMDWIAEVVPAEVLRQVVHKFAIPNDLVEKLCQSIFEVLHWPAVTDPASQKKDMADRRTRLTSFKSALENFKTLPEFQFLFVGGNPIAVLEPIPFGTAGMDEYLNSAISMNKFEDMLSVLISNEEANLRVYEAEEADRKELGNAVKLRRFVLWFNLLTFWYHDLGRKITVTIDSVTTVPSAPVIEFIDELSTVAVPAAERTPAAISKFIWRNRDRVPNDRNFGSKRWWDVSVIEVGCWPIKSQK